jgi:hypothetical protein
MVRLKREAKENTVDAGSEEVSSLSKVLHNGVERDGSNSVELNLSKMVS